MLGIVIQGRKAAHEGLLNLALLCSRERISQAQRIHSVFIKILPSCWWLMIDLEFREDATGRGESQNPHLGGVLGPSPSPWWTPTAARPGTDFRAYFIKQKLLGIVRLVIQNFFLTSSRHLDGVLGPSPSPWGTPTSARPGTDFSAYFMKEKLLGLVIFVI